MACKAAQATAFKLDSGESVTCRGIMVVMSKSRSGLGGVLVVDRTCFGRLSDHFQWSSVFFDVQSQYYGSEVTAKVSQIANKTINVWVITGGGPFR